MFPNGQKRNRLIRSTLQIHPPVIKPLRLLLADPRTGSTSRTAENTFRRLACVSRRWDFQSIDIFFLLCQSSPPLLLLLLPLLWSLTTKWIQTHPGEKGLIQRRHSQTALTKDPLGLLCVWILSAERWSKTLTMRGDEGGGGASREAKQISGAHNGLIPMAVLSIMFGRRNNVGARLLVVVRRLSTLKDLPQLLESFPPSQRLRSPFHLEG